MPVLVGTSGWQYRHWRERLYPKELAQKGWLEYYADRFRIVELNNSFYQLPKPASFEGWFKRTPEDFILAVKANRYITHVRRLRDVREAVDRFMQNVRHLGAKLGPVLLQLPPTLKANLPGLDATLARFPDDVRVAVEFRHDSWFSEEARALLAAHDAALCLADRGSRPLGPVWRTAAWTYLRFHQGRASPEPCYGRRALESWAGRLAEQWRADEDIYVFFNNDPRGCAVRDAVRFAAHVARIGLPPTRVPPEETKVG